MASLDREHGRGRSQERGRGRQTTYVVKKMVRDVGGAQYPMLTRTNYAEWVVLMKVMLKARRLRAAVTVGTADEEDDQSAMEAILKSCWASMLENEFSSLGYPYAHLTKRCSCFNSKENSFLSGSVLP